MQLNLSLELSKLIHCVSLLKKAIADWYSHNSNKILIFVYILDNVMYMSTVDIATRHGMCCYVYIVYNNRKCASKPWQP